MEHEIVSKKFPFENNFHAGSFLTTAEQNTTAEQEVGSCLLDKLSAIMDEDGIDEEGNDLRVDLAACCTKGDSAKCTAELSGAYAAIVSAVSHRRAVKKIRRARRKSRDAALDAWHDTPTAKAQRATERKARRLRDRSRDAALDAWRRKNETKAMIAAWKKSRRVRRHSREAALRVWRKTTAAAKTKGRKARRMRDKSRDAALDAWRKTAAAKVETATWKEARRAVKRSRRDALAAWRLKEGIDLNHNFHRARRLRKKGKRTALRAWRQTPAAKAQRKAEEKVQASRRSERIAAIKGIVAAIETRLKGVPLSGRGLRLLVRAGRKAHDTVAVRDFKKAEAAVHVIVANMAKKRKEIAEP